MAAENNTLAKSKIKEPQKSRPVAEQVSAGYGSRAAGSLNQSADSTSSPWPRPVQLSPASSAFTGLAMRQMPLEVSLGLPAHRTAQPLGQAAVLQMQRQLGNKHVQRAMVRQNKSRIAEPEDNSEREADRPADRAGRQPAAVPPPNDNGDEDKPAASRLWTHDLAHVIPQRAGTNGLQRQVIAPRFPSQVQATRQRPTISPTPHDVQRQLGWIGDELNDYARHIPGYTLFTVIVGFNPLTGDNVPRTATNLLEGLMGLVPFGTFIFDALREHGIIRAAFDWVEGELGRLNLSLARIEQTIEAAWDEMELIEGFDYNLRILERHFGALYNDVESFAISLVDHIIELIKEAAVDLAEGLLADNKAWDLIKKILHYDPLRGEAVEATTVEIVEDFLLLIGKETELEQMRERGTLQETADWLDTQMSTFMSLLGELNGLFSAAWEAIQPANLPNLVKNLRGLANQVSGFLQRVWSFASTVAIQVLELIKKALLSWLSEFAHEIPGFHLVTVILGKNPFTQEVVPRTAENIIKGFITLLPGGEEQYAQLQQTGTIQQAAQRIEGAMESLGINWESITALFRGIWDGLSINDLVDPIGAFQRIVDQFGEPISRLFAFIQVVVREIFMLILELMNFPTDIIARIISNAMQAFEDIKNDPIAFFKNMLEAVKLGFTHFFDNILQHLLTGVTEWLFGQLESAGIQPPTDLSLESILDLVLQILGISMENIWAKLAQRIGQENVDRIRGAIDRLTGIWTFIRDVQERGIAAIWEYIESQISNLWDMVLEKAKDWIVTQIVEKVVTKLISMLDPTGIMAVVNSFMAFFNAVQSAIEYIREILMIVEDYTSTIASVAQGNVAPGAEKMEQGLANSIPVAIGFLANQVGLGNLAEKIQEIIGGIREFVDQALDWLIDKAVTMGRGLLNTLGLGGERETRGEEDGAESAEVGVTEGDVLHIHTDFETAGEEHEISNQEGSPALVLSSATPIRLDAHPSQDVRDAYATYLQEIEAATSPTARREAANRNLNIIVNKIKAAGAADAPGASAPGIGTIDLHKNQQGRLRRSGVRAWYLESEHVIPRAFVNAAFEALAQAGVPAGGADYNNMHTILIYKGAADLKTEGSFGDASRINDFKTAIREIIHVVFGTHQRSPAAAREEMVRVTFSLLTAFASEAQERTTAAIQDENRENGAARGPTGSPEPPLPTAGDVRSAYSTQRDDINDQLEIRINDFVAEREASTG